MNTNTLSYKLFDNAPISAAILHKDTLKIEIANSKMLDLWSRPSSIIGMSLLDALPELADQRYPNYLKEVCRTGSPFEERGAQVMLTRSGVKQSVFMDYSYTPILNDDGTANGILVLATDVCERELNNLIVKQASRDLRSLVMSAPVPMCIYRGAKFKIEAVNDHMLDLWQDIRHRNILVLEHVFHNGITYSFNEDGIRYTYTSIGYGLNGVAGVCVVAVIDNG